MNRFCVIHTFNLLAIPVNSLCTTKKFRDPYRAQYCTLITYSEWVANSLLALDIIHSWDNRSIVSIIFVHISLCD